MDSSGRSIDRWLEREYRYSATAMLASVSPVHLVQKRPGFGQTMHAKRGAIVASPVLAAWDPEQNVQRVLELSGNPWAVLLGADGLLAGGPVAGEDGVTELVAAVIAEIDSAVAPVEQKLDS